MDQITNFIQLTERIGTAGQPTIKQFRRIQEASYQHIINLALPDHPSAIAEEGAIVTGLGMNYVHIPVPFDSPLPSHVGLFCRLMNSLKADKVFVHCIMNYRVSAFMFHYLTKVEGKEALLSRSAILQKWDMPPAWQQLMSWSKSDLGI